MSPPDPERSAAAKARAARIPPPNFHKKWQEECAAHEATAAELRAALQAKANLELAVQHTRTQLSRANWQREQAVKLGTIRDLLRALVGLYETRPKWWQGGRYTWASRVGDTCRALDRAELDYRAHLSLVPLRHSDDPDAPGSIAGLAQRSHVNSDRQANTRAPYLSKD